MNLTKISGACSDKVTCPTVYETDRGTVVVQGYQVTDGEALSQLDLPAGEGAVEIPRSLWTGANRG